MATNAFNSIYHHHHHHHHHTATTLRPHSTVLDYPPTTTNNTLFLKPTTNISSSAVGVGGATTNSTIFAAVSTPAAAFSQTTTTTYDLLEQHLTSKNYRQADEETRRLLIVLAGDAAEKRGYVFFSEVQFIPVNDLKTIDELWRKYSDGKFGYSVQRKIWNKCNQDFTKFFIKVGWMKLLDTEVVQYNYRAFPNEFMWEMEEGTQVGHLPLTNALRGTQLLTSIFNHPAFVEGDEDDDEDKEEKTERNNNGGIKPLSKAFKTSYTF